MYKILPKLNNMYWKSWTFCTTSLWHILTFIGWCWGMDWPVVVAVTAVSRQFYIWHCNKTQTVLPVSTYQVWWCNWPSHITFCPYKAHLLSHSLSRDLHCWIEANTHSSVMSKVKHLKSTTLNLAASTHMAHLSSRSLTLFRMLE